MSNWEKCVIGTGLFDPQTMAEANDLMPSDFSNETNQIIWAEMSMLNNNGGLDLRALVEAVRSSADHDRVVSDVGNLEDYVNECLSYRGTAMKTYSEKVLEGSIRRTLRRNAALIAAAAQEEDRPVEELLDYSEQKILNLRRTRLNESLSLADLVSQFRPRLEGQRNGTFKPAWEPKTTISDVIRFAESSDYIIIAARPGEGKSSLIRYEFFEFARQGNPCEIFNLENDPTEYVRNLAALRANINADLIKDPRLLSAEQLQTVNAALDEIQRMPIWVRNAATMTADQITRAARQSIAEKKLKLIGVDYVQLVNNGNASRNKNEEVSYTSRAFRALALDQGVPVVAAAQLSREVERRGRGNGPMLSDLRDSGCLSGETQVYLQDGNLAQIKDLVGKTPEVFAVNTETWKMENVKATKVWKTGTREVFKMKTSLGNEIRATDNHRFLTIDGWKRLDELSDGMRIASPRVVKATGNSTMSLDEVALLGHLIGDGCTLPSHVIQYTTKEEKLAEIVSDLTKRLFDIEPRINHERNWIQVYLSIKNPGQYRRNPISVWLENMGAFGLRSYEKRVPQIVFEQSDETIAVFLRHLWSTDGSVQIIQGKKPRPIAYYASSSFQLATDVKYLLLRIGIISKITKASNKKKGQWHVIVTGKPDLERFVEKIGGIGAKETAIQKVADYLETRNGVPNRDVIPTEIWKKVKSKMREIGMTHRELFAFMGWPYSGTARFKLNLSRQMLNSIAEKLSIDELKVLANSDVIWDEIISIEPDGIEDVFDMEVPANHNFVANGIIVHNSLEQDATIVVFPWLIWQNPTPEQLAMFPENKDRNGSVLKNPVALPMKFRILKNRNGSTGVTPMMKWVKSTGRYYPLLMQGG